MTWYTREDSEPSEEYGTIPEKRSVEELLQKGFVVVDKPFGPTSGQVSKWVKDMMDLKKTGHFGTLDPNATGILPVGLNSGTRVQDALSGASKEYVFEAVLEEERDEQKVREALNDFVGGNSQVPPEKSAVKREERTREMMEAELIEVSGKSVLARVKVESGFYVRVLIEQLGEKLDTAAKMEELRRTEQGHLNEEDAETLQNIVDAYRFYQDDGEEEMIREVVKPIEAAVQQVPKIVIKDSAVNAVANGADLMSQGVSQLEGSISQGDQLAIMTLKGELVALATAEASSEEIYNGEVKAADLESVHMSPEKYPKRWNQ